MGDDRFPSDFMSHLDGLDGFGKRTDLVKLNQDGVGRFFFDTPCNPAGIGHKKVIPDNLYTIAESRSHLSPALPLVFIQAVLDGKDGEALYPVAIEINHFVRSSLGAV